MTPAEYTHIRFPVFQLPSGKWVKIDMSVQQVSPSVGQPYEDDPINVTVSPWSEGGLPELEEAAAADAGLVGSDSIEFEFHNVPVNPTVDSVTLHEIILAQRPEETAWNIRVFYSGDSAPETFALRPHFWGIIEASEVSGSILRWEEKTWNTYVMNARNAIAIGERVSVPSWISGYLLHSVYDKIPTGGVGIDGLALRNILHDDGGTPRWRPFVYLRYFLLIDILHSVSQAIGITRPINDTGSGSGVVGHSWSFVWINSPDPDPTETPEPFEKLCVVSAIMLDPDNVEPFSIVPPAFNGNEIYQHEYGLFDDRKFSVTSFFNLGNVCEVLRRILVPFGLAAAVRVNVSGERYLEIREVDRGSVVTTASDLLEEMELEAGEEASYGFRVVTANNGELVDGESGDRSIDNMWMGATRIRLGDRWTHVTDGQQDHDTDDLLCLYNSLFLWLDGVSAAANVFKIIVRRDGDPATTARTHMPFPPAVYPNWNDMSGVTAKHEAGNVLAKACLAYYWNGTTDPETDPVGVYRRYTARLSWREGRIDQVPPRVGTRMSIGGAHWAIRKVRVSAVDDVTTFECERGSFHASP